MPSHRQQIVSWKSFEFPIVSRKQHVRPKCNLLKFDLPNVRRRQFVPARSIFPRLCVVEVHEARRENWDRSKCRQPYSVHFLARKKPIELKTKRKERKQFAWISFYENAEKFFHRQVPAADGLTRALKLLSLSP